MKLAPIAAALSLSLAPALSFAATTNNLDIYYVPSADIDIDVDGGGEASDDGDGYGIKGEFQFSDQAFFTGEYQSVDYDDAGDLDQIRAGIGYRFTTNALPIWYVRGEFVQLDDGDDEQNGYGVHGGVRGENGRLGIVAEAGYVDVDDADGFEFLVGGDYSIDSTFALFADYRYTDLDFDGGDITLKDVRLGVRARF